MAAATCVALVVVVLRSSSLRTARPTGEADDLQAGEHPVCTNADSVSDPSDFCPHIRPVDESCPRFFTYEISEETGLGHRLSELQFGWRGALRLNATYVAPTVHAFSSERKGDDYGWAYHLLGLGHGEMLTTATIHERYPNATRENACPYINANQNTQCNVFFVAPNAGCCGKDNCFVDSSNWALYDSSKSCLRWKRRFGSLFSKSYYNIVWHIRVGDTSFHKGDSTFFARVVNVLNTALDDLSVRHYVLYDGNETLDRNKLPERFEFLDAILKTYDALPTATSLIAFHYMESADMLVSTGSSFPEVPMLSSLNADRTLFLQHTPKHQQTPLTMANITKMIEYMSDTIPLFPDGTLGMSEDEFRRRVLKQICFDNASRRRFQKASNNCSEP